MLTQRLETNKDVLFVFGDVHGDFTVLVELFTNVLQVATYAHQQWTWTALDTTVVCLGDFVDRFRLPQPTKLTTQEAIADEIRILHCFRSLQAQVSIPKNNSQLVVLVGNHEVANIVASPEYWRSQIARPESGYERGLRRQFVRNHLVPFCLTCGVVARWANYFLCHASLEAGWLLRHQFRSIPDINQRFRTSLRKGLRHTMDIFLEPDSLLVSRKMALHPTLWREQDKADVAFLLSSELVPKFISGHTTVQSIQSEGADYDTPRCIDAAGSSILSSRDYNNMDDLFFLDVAMSDGFTQPNSEPEALFARRPQALKLIVHSDGQGTLLFEECATVALSAPAFTAMHTVAPTPAPVKTRAPVSMGLTTYHAALHTNLDTAALFVTMIHRNTRTLLLVQQAETTPTDKTWGLPATKLGRGDPFQELGAAYRDSTGQQLPTLRNIRRFVWKGHILLFVAEASDSKVASGRPLLGNNGSLRQLSKVALAQVNSATYPLQDWNSQLVPALLHEL